MDKNFKKNWMASLSFLDNCYINSIIVISLALYCSTIFENINKFVGNLYNFSIVKVIVLLLIIYVAQKDTTIAVLFGLSYIISLMYSNSLENFSHNTPTPTPITPMPSPITPMPSHITPMPTPSTRPPSTRPPSTRTPPKEERESFDIFGINPDSNTEYESKSKSNEMREPVKNSCMGNYVPKFETVNDVCNPVATFKNELNAQGLNSPEGFNSLVTGSPL